MAVDGRVTTDVAIAVAPLRFSTSGSDTRMSGDRLGGHRQRSPCPDITRMYVVTLASFARPVQALVRRRERAPGGRHRDAGKRLAHAAGRQDGARRKVRSPEPHWSVRTWLACRRRADKARRPSWSPVCSRCGDILPHAGQHDGQQLWSAPVCTVGRAAADRALPGGPARSILKARTREPGRPGAEPQDA